MKPTQFPTDEENVCLKCKWGITPQTLRYQPWGNDHYVTYCVCALRSIRGRNTGHRKKCAEFEKDGGRDNDI